MIALSDWIPYPFATAPAFHEFAFAAQQAGEHEQIIFRDGLLTHLSKGEESNKDVNRRTWRAFTSAVERVFSQEKIQEICARYNNIQWSKLKNSTLPFEKRYIEYFGVGAGCVHVWDLQQTIDDDSSWFRWLINYRSPEEIKYYYDKATALQYLGITKDPKKLDGSPQEQHETATLDTLNRDKQRCNLFMGIEDLISNDPNIPPLHPYYSRLAMAIICLLDTQDKGLIIPGPRGPYKVYDVISKSGLTLYALKPLAEASSEKPILAFRCTNQAVTQTNAIPSVLNDFERHIGKTGYEACKEELAALMEDQKFTNGKKPVVLGYSLGGGHASYFFHDFWEKVSEIVLFNSVGTDETIVKDTANQINALDDAAVPPAIYQHRNVCNKEGTVGDWVNKLGDKHLGWGIHHPNTRINIFEWMITDYPPPGSNPFNPEDVMKSFNIHAVRLERGYRYNLHQGPTACDPILDTYNRDCSLEDARQSFGRMYFQVIREIYQLIDLVLRIFDIEFFKKHG